MTFGPKFRHQSKAISAAIDYVSNVFPDLQTSTLRGTNLLILLVYRMVEFSRA